MDEDRTKTAGSAMANALGLPSGQARMLPCRDCGVETECASEAWEMAKIFSRQLHRMGEPSLKRNEIIRCDRCSDAFQAQKHREMLEHTRRVNELRAMIREKAEPYLIRQLQDLNPCEETDRFVKHRLERENKYTGRRPPPRLDDD